MTVTTISASDSAIYATFDSSGDSIQIAATPFDCVSVALSGGWVGTVAFEGTVNDVDWFQVYGTLSTLVGTYASTTTSGVWFIPTAGLSAVRPRCSSYTSGTISVFVRGTTGWVPSAASVLGAGSSLVGDVGLQVRAGAGGISQVSRLLSSTATTNITLVKSAGGRVYKIICRNTSATTRYLKLFNKATAPTLGSNTPTETFEILANSTFEHDFGTLGRYYSSGIGFAITAAAADADATVVAAGDIVHLHVWYA